MPTEDDTLNLIQQLIVGLPLSAIFGAITAAGTSNYFAHAAFNSVAAWFLFQISIRLRGDFE